MHFFYPCAIGLWKQLHGYISNSALAPAFPGIFCSYFFRLNTFQQKISADYEHIQLNRRIPSHSQMPRNGEKESFRLKLSYYSVNTWARDAAIVGNCHKYSPELQKYRENQEQSKYSDLPYRVMEGWRENGADDCVLGGGAGTGRAETRTDDPMKTL